MPRQDRPALRSAVLAVPNAFTASAINMAKMPSMAERNQHRAESWQEDAWGFLDTVSEYSYSVSWVGNLLSKAKLTVLENGAPTENADALEALNALFGGPDGQAEMLRMLGIHFTVAGEAYIIATEGRTGLDEWLVVPAVDLKKLSGEEGEQKWTIGHDINFINPLVIRMWSPHPRSIFKSRSPSRAVLPILAEIDGLTKHVAAQIDSRLAGAGLLLLPSEIDFAGTQVQLPGVAGAEEVSREIGLSGFLKDLTEVFSEAIRDRSSPSALVPYMLQVSGEYVDKIKHLTFYSELDKATPDMRHDAVRRLGLGMDMPPEILTGMGDLNHWASWSVEEAAIKAHSGPLLAVIVRALAVGYLQPFLQSGDSPMSPDEAAKFSFGVDDAEMRLRPNRSKEAIELYDRGALSMKALLRENGFDFDGDAPSTEDLQAFLLKNIAKGSTTPELVEAANRALGVVLEIRERAAEAETQEARPRPSLEEHPSREIPEQLDPSVQAAGVMVHRALERAGNRLRTRMGRKVTGVTASATYQHVHVDPDELDALLEGAWAICQEMPGLGVDPKKIDRYTRDLLLTGNDIDMAKLHELLT